MQKITLKQARVLAGFTQQQMADKLDMHVHTYRKIELNPALATIRQGEAIATITDTDFETLFFDLSSTKSRNADQITAG